MEWKQFTQKYGSYSKQFNDQSYEERVRVSRLMTYDAIRELIRSKRHLKKAMDEINARIKELSKQLDEGLGEGCSQKINGYPRTD